MDNVVHDIIFDFRVVSLEKSYHPKVPTGETSPALER